MGMDRPTDLIEVDKATAARLKERAAELGMTVEEFLAAIASERLVILRVYHGREARE